jgi:hypothetical protein
MNCRNGLTVSVEDDGAIRTEILLLAVAENPDLIRDGQDIHP